MLSRACISESRATDECREPELEGFFLGRGDTEVLVYLVLWICLAFSTPRRAYYWNRLDLSFFSPMFDISALLMLPLSPDSLALRAVIGLFNPLGFALPSGCLPMPLSLCGSTALAFSGYRAVPGTKSLGFIIHRVILFSLVERNEGCWRV